MIELLKYITPSMFVIAFGGIILSFIGMRTALSKREETPRKFALLTFIAGLTIIGGGVWSGIEQNKSNNDKIKLTDRILSLTKKNAFLSQKTNNIITGGDSFCYISFDRMETNRGTLNARIIPVGKFTIYDLTITFLDLTKLSQLETKTKGGGYYTGDMNKIIKLIKVGNISSNTSFSNSWFLKLSNMINVNKLNEYKINIFFSARNGSWTQQIRLKKHDLGGFITWVQATEVLGNPGKHVEIIDENYPLNNKGEVEW